MKSVDKIFFFHKYLRFFKELYDELVIFSPHINLYHGYYKTLKCFHMSFIIIVNFIIHC